MLVRCSQDVLPPETKAAASVAHPPMTSVPTFTYLHQVMGLVLVNVKRKFDAFMVSNVLSINVIHTETLILSVSM